jgi:Galactosyltransferase
MTTLFVLGNPGTLWKTVILAENEIFHDLIILDNVPENSRTANTVKTIEFLKWLVMLNNSWTFVSKIDDDSFLNARAFWDQYLLPLKSDVESASMNIIIGRNVSNFGSNYPGGQFYTMSWNIALTLAALQTHLSITDTDEDLLIERLLSAGGVNWNFITLPSSMAFDFDQDDAMNHSTAWAQEDSDQDAWAHAVGSRAINPHKMKDDETYLKVVECFDEAGIKQVLIGERAPSPPPMPIR